MKPLAAIALLLFGVISQAPISLAEDASTLQPKPEKTVTDTNSLFQAMLGNWQGRARTWFEPEKLADESSVIGSIRLLPEGNFIRHDYQGSMQGKPRHGEETITINTVTKKVQVVWFDSFHMNYAFLQSEGSATPNSLNVSGKYDVSPEHPQWGWRTEYVLHDADHLTITAYNVMPEGAEGKAVETVYVRLKP